jgi:CheY-like chemotaxis protein
MIEAAPDLPTVLLVDDDPAILNGLGDFLRDEGFAVVAASNGAEALACLRLGLRPDVILLDVMMPVMDGWDFRAEQLCDPASRAIPVVVISASGFSRDTIGAQLRAYDVFSKPLELERFIETLREVCGRADSDQGTSITGG